MHPKSFVGRALPGPAGRAYSASQTPAGFKGPTSKEGEGGEGREVSLKFARKKANHFLHRLLDKNTRRSGSPAETDKKMNRDQQLCSLPAIAAKHNKKLS